MQLFEIICMALGLANGALLALLPDALEQKRPIGAVVAFSVAGALLTLFLPIVVSSPRFLATLVFTFISAAVGWFSIATLNTKQAKAVSAGVQIPTLHEGSALTSS